MNGREGGEGGRGGGGKWRTLRRTITPPYFFDPSLLLLIFFPLSHPLFFLRHPWRYKQACEKTNRKRNEGAERDAFICYVLDAIFPWLFYRMQIGWMSGMFEIKEERKEKRDYSAAATAKRGEQAVEAAAASLSSFLSPISSSSRTSPSPLVKTWTCEIVGTLRSSGGLIKNK